MMWLSRGTLQVLAVLCSSLLSTGSYRTLAAQQDPRPIEFRIVVLEGQGAINNINLGAARDPVVRVEDNDGAPVVGAVVTFLLPMTGPGATFANGATSATLTSGGDGTAAARGLRPNSSVGSYEILVSASYEGQVARAVIAQTNAAPAVTETSGGGSSLWIVILGLVAGGAAAGVLATQRGGGNGGPITTPPPVTIPPPTITAGAPTFGAPQ